MLEASVPQPCQHTNAGVGIVSSEYNQACYISAFVTPCLRLESQGEKGASCSHLSRLAVYNSHILWVPGKPLLHVDTEGLDQLKRRSIVVFEGEHGN